MKAHKTPKSLGFPGLRLGGCGGYFRAVTGDSFDGLPHAPATLRNRGPILDVLTRVLPREGTVLEIASGTGEHAAWFAERLPHIDWQPSEPDARLRQAIVGRAANTGLANLRPPLAIGAADPDWGVGVGAGGARIDAVVCINMTQVVPWPAIEGLFAGAARTLAPGGVLYVYGPFKRGGRHTSPGNAAFDDGIRAQNPEWGVRDADDLDALAKASGFAPAELVEMPANNLSLIYRKL